MMENVDNIYEPIDRDYENVPSGKERKILFYSKTLETIRKKYWNWRSTRLQKKKNQIKQQIGVQQKIISDQSIGERNQKKRARIVERLQDKIDLIDLELETTHYPSIKVRLLKVAERARKNISACWTDFIKNIPIVGRIYRNHMVMEAATDDVSEGPIQVGGDDSNISYESVKDMVESQLDAAEASDERQSNSSSTTNGWDSTDFETPNSTIESPENDSTYRLGREELAGLNNGLVDASTIMSPSEIKASQERIIGDSTQPDIPVTFSETTQSDQSKSEQTIPVIPPERSDFQAYEIPSFSNMTSGATDSSSALTQEDDMHFTVPVQRLEGEYQDFTLQQNTSLDQMVGTDSDRHEETLDADFQKYSAILKDQTDRRYRMNEKYQEDMGEAKEQYSDAKEKNKSARAANEFMKDAIAAALGQLEQEMKDEAKRKEAEVQSIRDATTELDSDTDRLEKANQSLREMCDALSIPVSKSERSDARGRVR